MSIPQKIRAYYGDLFGDEHHRYRSWEHCYRFFRRLTLAEIMSQRDIAALQLGFYLASWGMYPGSSFLLQHAYTVHLGVIDALAIPRFLPLWQREFGAAAKDLGLLPTVLAAVSAVREAYAPFGQPTDTLVTKVLLGTLGCLPACDRYFIDGFKSKEFSYSYLNAAFVQRIFRFCRNNLIELRSEQARIERSSGVRYPLMKLVDMYFWQLGYELNGDGACLEEEVAEEAVAANRPRD
jgi:hypothetical protein